MNLGSPVLTVILAAIIIALHMFKKHKPNKPSH